jgi:hypothetical protein
MSKNEGAVVVSHPDEFVRDTEAATGIDDAPEPSSDVRWTVNEEAPVGSHMEKFEIEMGDRDGRNTTRKNVGDSIETNIRHTSDVSEIPSIMTAPSMDDSIDEDIVEMASLLQNTSGHHDKKHNKKNAKNEPNPTNPNRPSQETPIMKDANTSTSGSKSQNVVLQKCCSYYYCCYPCNTIPASSATTRSSTTVAGIPTKPYRMGNIQVLYPPLYIRTNGWFVLGPHWFGPPFILFIVLISSYYIIYVRCYRRHWYLTTMVCALLCASTVYHLLNTAYRDPGVITKHSLPINHNDPASIPRSYRYCDTCQYYQPSHAAHCPDCNVCVAGFDHHCVWMSICIGVGNYKVSNHLSESTMIIMLWATPL